MNLFTWWQLVCLSNTNTSRCNENCFSGKRFSKKQRSIQGQKQQQNQPKSKAGTKKVSTKNKKAKESKNQQQNQRESHRRKSRTDGTTQREKRTNKGTNEKSNKRKNSRMKHQWTHSGEGYMMLIWLKCGCLLALELLLAFKLFACAGFLSWHRCYRWDARFCLETLLKLVFKKPKQTKTVNKALLKFVHVYNDYIHMQLSDVYGLPFYWNVPPTRR